ncbi:SDR family oxidoreductase [Robiginitalea sp. M366]|uniref:SDR family oxidoreductase n=1 Tax=Robiginitalea aestuariiviva TaxID=3036903 RepID=UPI00240DDDD1|nr:SDR family oxidoreductase [Robiginitalea aestuariiviva]MDG1573100.1 SDR family oxidoreductase [Robiginitalea aestuariiviva]
MPDPAVVLITGASSGLGKATGQFLASRGYRVYGTARNPGRYPDFEDFPLLAMDVCQPESVRAAVARLLEQEGRIDVLINNAGVGITGPMEETPYSEVCEALETNFHGPLRVMGAVAPQMRKQGSGFIVNITSIAGYMGLPFRGVYSASKGALQVATEAYRMELRPFGIRVATLAPGDYATNIASGRYHTPLSETSPYRDTYGKSLELMDAHVDQGGDPAEVARAVYRILQKRTPKVHYTVGSPLQRFSLVLKRILPDTWYERLLRNHYKL